MITRHKPLLGFMVLTLFFCVTMAGWAQSSLKIGVIDTQRVLEEYKRATNAMGRLDSERDRLRAKGQTLVEQLREMQEKLTKQRKFLNEDQVTQTENDIRIKETEIESFTTTAQQTLDDMQQTLFDPIIDEVEGYILNIGKQEEFTMLLRKQLVVLYVKPEFDLTERVIKELNEKFAQPKPQDEPKDALKNDTKAPKSQPEK